MKQHTEKTKFVKEPKENTQEYILQKNKKTKVGATIIVVFLVILVVGIIVSNFFFTS